MSSNFLFRLFLLMATMTWLTTSAAAEDKAKKSVKRIKIASVSIQGPFPETSTQVGLFGEMEQNLRDTIRRIHDAAEDEEVEALVLRIRTPGIGRAKIDEIREAVQRARAKGTKVYADISGAMGVDYLIACACDEIIIPPSGSLILPGVRAEVMFYKGLFEKIGVKADFIQIGRFKGAAEPYVRSEMSPEFRKQYEAVIDDYYEQMVATIAEARGLEAERVSELIDQGMFSASRAKEAGLVDKVLYEDEFRDQFREQHEADKLGIINNYGKKNVDADFSGIGGMMNLMQLMMGVESNAVRSRNDRIAVVYAVGPIMDGVSEQSLFGGSTLGGDTVVAALRKAAKHKRVKAIVLRVDSPGGSALASDLIWREVTKIKKPVVASMGDYAASGGYYISMGADKIYAAPGTLTGSIGVVGGKLAVGGLYDKIGLSVDVIARGKNSGAFSMTDGFSDSERAAMKSMMLDIYKQFTSKAAEGRHMELAKIESLAEGRVFTGRQAKENGLIDELGTLRDAIAEAKKMAELGDDDKVDLWILPKPRSFFETMFEGESLETASSVPAQMRTALPELTEPLVQTEWLRRMFQQPVNTILPYRVEIK